MSKNDRSFVIYFELLTYVGSYVSHNVRTHRNQITYSNSGFFWLPAVKISRRRSENEDGSWQTRLKIMWIKLEYITSSVNLSSWVMFPLAMFLFFCFFLHKRQHFPWSHSTYVFLIERPLAAETTYCGLLLLEMLKLTCSFWIQDLSTTAYVELQESICFHNLAIDKVIIGLHQWENESRKTDIY